jgi:cytochrome c-type biogenesis protein CcmH
MTLWFVFALMTVAAIFAVLWPLSRATSASSGGSEAAVYKDQLAEIERDAAAGLIGSSEAEAARVEIGRRLLAADGQDELPTRSNLALRRASAVVALVGLPVAAVMFYLALGSPRLGDFPLASRTRTADVNQPLENMVAQVEAHLEKNPADARGWTVLAPVLARLGRFADAAQAYRNVITYAGDSAERRADLGEALALVAGGVVTAEAKAEFERAIAQDADEPRSNYFLGLAAEQDGRQADAAAIWRAVLAKAPQDAPWRQLVQEALTRVGGSVAAPLSKEAMAVAKDMSDPDRNEMIRGMVDRLATRLKQDGNDVEGWLRLMRAYMVMGERDKAASALTNARQAVAADAERLRQLNEGAKNLGLDG